MIAVACLACLVRAVPIARPSWAAVLVDPLYKPRILESLSNFRAHVSLRIPIYVMTGAQYQPQYRQIEQAFGLRVMRQTFEQVNTTKTYSALLTSTGFWNLFTEDYLLIFQGDTRFCMHSGKKVEDFVGRFDFIGAPWNIDKNRKPASCGMNGGFSLRSRAAMLLCSTRTGMGGNEDGVFNTCLRQKGARLPTCDEALEFSMESYNREPVVSLGSHKVFFPLPEYPKHLAPYCPDAAFSLFNG